MSDDGPQWQDDASVTTCFLCGVPYLFFNRRHHCRKCGRVVCNNCSLQHIRYFPNTTITRGPYQRATTTPGETYKTCDACVEEIRMISQALGEVALRNSSQASLAPNTAKYALRQRTFVRSGTSSIKNDDSSDSSLCPVCAANLPAMFKKANFIDFEDFKTKHISDCLVAQDFEHDNSRSKRRNKMLVYNMQPIPDPRVENIGSVGSVSDTDPENECVICLEELNPGDKVARLECLCIFHYRCIKDWFNRGNGECPVHFMHKRR